MILLNFPWGQCPPFSDANAHKYNGSFRLPGWLCIFVPIYFVRITRNRTCTDFDLKHIK